MTNQQTGVGSRDTCVSKNDWVVPVFTSFGRTDETFSSLWTETLVEVWVELGEVKECSDDDDGDDGDENVEIGEEIGEVQMEISPAVLFSFLRLSE